MNGSDCYVYRLFAADDTLLYVGCSMNVDRRIGSHRNGKPWGAAIARYTVEGPFSARDGLDREAEVIGSERPRFNRTHNPTPPPPDPAHWREAAAHAALMLDISYACAYRAVGAGLLPDRPASNEELREFVDGAPSTPAGARLRDAMAARLYVERVA